MKRALCIASLVAACGGSSNNAGVVPADLRDVERAGEGLVSTTFGDLANNNTPAWDRAATIQSILKQVWGRGKAANPGLPAAQVKLVDDAIVTLDTAIPKRDQRAAVYASNSVGLACPELFDFFHPDAPKEIIRMDAVYRQLGIDAHFADLTSAKADLASLQTDWNNSKAAVAQRAPKCSRVGGTMNVSTDIDQSLAKVASTLPGGDGKTAEKESENGAGQIDTLELLFDCPPDNVAPLHGTGAACSTTADCDKGLECDTAWGSGGGKGKCAPSASNKIGTACATTLDCGSDARSTCLTEAGDNYKGGYCFMEPCNDVDVCPPGATCVAIGGESPGCYQGCAKDSDCRVAEGYVCQLFVTSKPKGFGPTDHACAFPCTRNEDCQPPLTCPNPSLPGMPMPNDPTYGKCTP